MRGSWLRHSAVTAVLMVCTAGAVPAQSTTVVLVRHAEKVDDSADPELSAAGNARAVALADVLADGGVSAILTTQYRRTRMTATPTAERSGVAVEVVAASGSGHAAAVAVRVRELANGGTILVVGHSNTVPAIIRALGGPDVQIAGEEYYHLFVLTLDGSGARLIRGRY
ncbi:MAG TPA: histidine phosphatase family protein [Longimicrobiales bacterium]